MRKRVAIIGGGASGLAAIKECKEEGLDPVCFEKMSAFGGTWHYRDELTDGVASVMKSTIINTSKEMTAFSDFPPPKNFSNFMHNKFILDYYKSYVQKFDLIQYIRFNTEVIQVEKSKETYNIAKWVIKSRSTVSQNIKEEIFDNIMVCIGHHVQPYIPDFPGISEFKGHLIHSHEYKTYKGFEDKRVLIVGFGNSAMDAAVELSRVASQVYLSTRRGAWILNRVSRKGYPLDFELTRFNALLYWLMPWFVNKAFEFQFNSRFDHAMYGIKPDHGPFSQHPTISDELPNRIISGTVVIKSNIKSFTANGVIFSDGSNLELDAIILCTGYQLAFPGFPNEVLPLKDNKVKLFKFIFPLKKEYSSLAVIGLVQPVGPVAPISELQCRLVVKVFSGKIKLPDENIMLKDLNSKESVMAKRYVKSQRHTIQVDFVTYMDELAKMINVKPNLTRLFIRDPKLALYCFFGPCFPYQYRLTGPGHWLGAREAILGAEDRMKAAFKTMPVINKKKVFYGVSLYLSFLIVFSLFLYPLLY